MSNLLVSAISGGAKGESKTNPCSWYVLNLTLDCTLGVLILTGYLKVFGLLVRRYEIQGMESGDYGEPPQWKRWAKQASVFCMGMVFMKLTVVFLITVLPFLVNIGDMILKPVQLTHSPRFQIVFVMAIWPLTLNIFESWVIDQFIKTRRPHGHVPVADSATSFEMAGTAAPSGTVGETEHRFSIDMDGEFDFSDDDEDGTAAAGKFAGRSAKYTTVKSEDTLTMRDSFALDEEEHDLGLGKQHQD
ncbi:hypothetical protein FBU59_005127 [Linderina macrospora]|uniref:Uncharacterized protein n=1 Tax=Linderina macrospora TaxID=4868 RepID=A0ACC1J3F1_9FUNG|nr:hypothetical protein FBU59_005127 [Linderina macrospora]